MKRAIEKACLVMFIFVSLFAGQPAYADGAEIQIHFEPEKTFSFPTLIFGFQEEVFVLPYVSSEQWNTAKDLGVALLRYPAGTSADWFAWDDPERGYWPSEFEQKRLKLYPDAYVDLCRRMNMTPLIIVNTNLHGIHQAVNRINPMRVESIRKGAAYAAAWVKHANIDKKQGVKFWEIGNETWIWMKEREYPIYVREYAKAMRKVDPSIKIVACGLSDDAGRYEPWWLDRDFKNDPTWKSPRVIDDKAEEWTEALLDDAKGDFDYLGIHIYLGGQSMDPIDNGREVFASIANNTSLDRQIELIHRHKSPVRLAMTEWMINHVWSPANKGVRLERKQITKEQFDRLDASTSPMNAFVGALLAADWMGKMISSGYVDIAVAHTLDEGLSLEWDRIHNKVLSPPLVQPVGMAMRFWQRFRGDRVLPVRIAGSPAYVYKDKNVPILSSYATSKGNKAWLFLINRSPDQSVRVSVPNTLGGRRASSVVEHTLSAPSWKTNVWATVEDRSRSPIKQASSPVGIEVLKDYQVAPSRLTCLEISYDGEPAAHRSSFKKILIIGNSLTRQPPIDERGWKTHCGMAATGEDKDYAHLLYKKICLAQPQLKPELQLDRIGLERTMSVYNHLIPCKADLIIVELGDNYKGKANAEEFLRPYENMLSDLKKGHASPVYCLSTWGTPQLNPWIKKAAEEQGAVYVDISHLFANPVNRAISEGHFKDAGVNWHPGDRGMQAIADILWRAIESEKVPAK